MVPDFWTLRMLALNRFYFVVGFFFLLLLQIIYTQQRYHIFYGNLWFFSYFANVEIAVDFNFF